MGQNVKVKAVEYLSHDILRVEAEKPANLDYRPGQAADIILNREGWQDQIRTFTFTSLPQDDFIEFNIKTYPSHNGVTNQLRTLKVGEELIIGDVYGDIQYKGEGVFIAGGAGITPFLAILKDLERQNKVGGSKLIFANKTKGDIIWHDKFSKMLGNGFINVLSDEKLEGYKHGFVSPEIIKEAMEENLKYYYLCGPPPMMNAVEKHLASLGIDEAHIVKEGF